MPDGDYPIIGHLEDQQKQLPAPYQQVVGREDEMDAVELDQQQPVVPASEATEVGWGYKTRPSDGVRLPVRDRSTGNFVAVTT